MMPLVDILYNGTEVISFLGPQVWGIILSKTKGKSRYFNLELSFNCCCVLREICLDHKFQGPQKGFNCKYLAYKAVQILLLSLEFVIQTNFKHETTAKGK